ncbi:MULTISPECIES: hypothetical protein [unclassified Helicobacter]|uniref:hypothetical protein n=1 Tax=unclassified Helicobacter TaxID=2593540 RepID=UPI000CF0F909|nr:MULTISPECIES: hypothetical protein [unclassified Helicobacter]
MLIRRISKVALLAGAGLIVLLGISLLYVGSKIKKEFEQKIHENLATLATEGYELVYEPFKCRGFLSYECSSKSFKILKASDASLLLSMKNLRIGLKDIETYSMQEYVKADIDKINYDMPDDFKPIAIKLFITDQVRDKREGVVRNDGWFEIETKSALFTLKLDMYRKDPAFTNKNMIKIALQMPINSFLDNTLLNIQNLSFKVKSNHIYQSLLKANNMQEEEYQKHIDLESASIQMLVGLYAEVLNLPDRQEIFKALEAYKELLKGQKDSVEVGLKIREQGEYYFNSSYLKNIEGLKMILSQIFASYNIYVIAQ